MSAAEVTRPPRDKREYKASTLSNGLKYLLISDPPKSRDDANTQNSENKQSSGADTCAIAVFVEGGGNCNDSKEREGIAHLLEHCVFLGSEKFPEKTGFNEFLRKSGGSSNAATNAEHCKYYAQVLPDYFDELVERVADFLRFPLLSEDVCYGEASQVDAEHARNAQRDGHREYQMMRRLCSEKHTWNRFGTGSSRTLFSGAAQITFDDTETNVVKEAVLSDGSKIEGSATSVRVRQQRAEVACALREFHKTYYSSDYMTVIVAADRPLEELETLIQRTFGDIQQKPAHVCPPLESRYGGVESAYTPKELGRLARLNSVKQEHFIIVWFPLPAIARKYRYSKPTSLLGGLIGHESDGSLLAELKRLKWADDLSAGSGSTLTCFELFSVSIKLTDEGFAHWREVIALMFSYIGMLQREHRDQPGTALRREWEEQKLVSDAEFEFLEVPSTLYSTVQSYANRCHIYEPAELIVGPYLRSEFDPEAVSLVLDRLTPQNSQMMLRSYTFSGNDAGWIGDPDYPTKYFIENFNPSDFAEGYSRALQDATSTTVFHLPAPNPFLCDSFKVHPVVSEKPVPKLIAGSGAHGYRVWHCTDTVFEVPKSSFEVRFFHPMLSSADAWVHLMVFMSVFEESRVIQNQLYLAALANCRFHATKHATNISLRFHGFSQKLAVLVKLVTKQMVEIALLATDESHRGLFVELQEMLGRILNLTAQRYRNVAFVQAHEQAGELHQGLLLERHVSPEMKQNCADRLLATYHSCENDPAKCAALLRVILRTGTEFLGSAFCEVLSHGNVTDGETKEMFAVVQEQVGRVAGPEPIPQKLFAVQRSVALSISNAKSRRYVKVAAHTDPDSTNSCVHAMFECGPKFVLGNPYNAVREAQLAVFEQLTDHYFFDRLRTEDNLGYIVWSGFRTLGSSGARFFRITVQSTKFSTAHVQDRIDAALQKCEGMVATLDLEQFRSTINSVLQHKRKEDKRLSERTARFREVLWGTGARGVLVWDRREQETAVLQESLAAIDAGNDHGPVSRSSMVEFFQRVLGSAQVSVVVHVQAKGVAESEVPTGIFVSDSATFHASQVLLSAPLLSDQSLL